MAESLGDIARRRNASASPSPPPATETEAQKKKRLEDERAGQLAAMKTQTYKAPAERSTETETFSASQGNEQFSRGRIKLPDTPAPSSSPSSAPAQGAALRAPAAGGYDTMTMDALRNAAKFSPAADTVYQKRLKAEKGGQ